MIEELRVFERRTKTAHRIHREDVVGDALEAFMCWQARQAHCWTVSSVETTHTNAKSITQASERSVSVTVSRRNPQTASPVRLSVVVRTQGVRIHDLERALTCLAGQRTPGFEVIVVLAMPERSGADALGEWLLAGWWAEVLTVIPIWCPTAGRSAPLNAGLVGSRGDYCAFLDEDDFVMSNWTGTTIRGMLEKPGKVIRQGVLVAHLDDGLSPEVPARVISWQEKYAGPWNVFQHLIENHTPIMGWAVPWGVLRPEERRLFDTDLAVAEDWDYLMEAIFTHGIHDMREATSVYRMAQQTNSRVPENDVDWTLSFHAVRSRLDSRAVTLDPGWLTQFADCAAEDSTRESGSSVPNGTSTICMQMLEIESLRERLVISESARLDTVRDLRKWLRVNPAYWLLRSMSWISRLGKR